MGEGFLAKSNLPVFLCVVELAVTTKVGADLFGLAPQRTGHIKFSLPKWTVLLLLLLLPH